MHPSDYTEQQEVEDSRTYVVRYNVPGKIEIQRRKVVAVSTDHARQIAVANGWWDSLDGEIRIQEAR